MQSAFESKPALESTIAPRGFYENIAVHHIPIQVAVNVLIEFKIVVFLQHLKPNLLGDFCC